MSNWWPSSSSICVTPRIAGESECPPPWNSSGVKTAISLTGRAPEHHGSLRSTSA